MKTTILLLASFAIIVSNKSSACYNEFQSLNSSGQFHLVDEYELDFYTNFDNKVINKQLTKLYGQLKSKPSLAILSDYALYLVRGGKTTEALEIFKALENKFPNEYIVNANLGTTYELMGDNEMALKYIKKSLQINPNSHNGSEWIHVKLLELKLKLAKQPNLFEKRSLLELSKTQQNSNKVRLQILEQLKERFRFCRPPDEVMSALLIDLGDCYKAQLSFEHAKAIYETAQKYYQSKNKLLNQRIAECKTLRAKNANVHPTTGLESNEYGTLEKVGGVRYQSLLNTNDNSKSPISWSSVETDPEKLLEFLDLKLVDEKTDSADSSATSLDPNKLPKVKGVKKGNSYLNWKTISGSVLILLALGLAFRKRRKGQ